MSIYDTYRVVYTVPGSNDFADPAMGWEAAMERFNERVVMGGFVAGSRLRVISEKTWIETQAVMK